MNGTPLTVQGTIDTDGQLKLDEPLPQFAGRGITVQPLPVASEPHRFWKMMEGIWTDLRKQPQTANQGGN